MLYVARKLPDGSVLRLAVSEARLRQVELGYLWAMRLAIAAACLVLFLIGVGGVAAVLRADRGTDAERLGDRRRRFRARPAVAPAAKRSSFSPGRSSA